MFRIDWTGAWPAACKTATRWRLFCPLWVSAGCHLAALYGLSLLHTGGGTRQIPQPLATLSPAEAESPALSWLPDSLGRPAVDAGALAPQALASPAPFAALAVELPPLAWGSPAGQPGGAAQQGGSAAPGGKSSRDESTSSGSATFFGLTAGGDEFVFLVDMSGSMEGKRFRRARAELRRSIESLAPWQRYYVVFFNHDVYPMPAPGLVAAHTRNLAATNRWIRQARCHGDTDPLPALRLAFRLEPDAVFLLSDGKFDPAVLLQVAARRADERVPVHTISFVNREGEPLLAELARMTGGTHRFVR